MSESAPSIARAALDELLDVSPQVDAVVLLRHEDGELLASAPHDFSASKATAMARTSTQILEAAEVARRELGREPVAQVEVATRDGHVFVVADAAHIVAAVTDADPTVGLVFYDLKTALRSMRESSASSNGVVIPVATADANEVEPDATSAGSGKSGKWKRRKS